MADDFPIAIYHGHSPDLTAPPDGALMWSKFKAAADYSVAQYQAVRLRLLQGDRWLMCEPDRTVYAILEGSAPARFYLKALTERLECQNGNYLEESL